MAQPTMEDVARAAGVSRALVSLVMREAPNVSDVRRTAVLEAAERLGYRPNLLARNLASRQTATLGVMIDDLHNPFFAEVVDGVHRVADQAGYQLMLTTGRLATTSETAALETLLRFRVDGLVLVGLRQPTEDVEKAAALIPTVLVARRMDSEVLDTVNNDEAEGARLAVTHLAELGHRRIAHIDGGAGASAPDRRAGYEAAMRDAGLERFIEVVDGEFTEPAGVAALDELLASADRPTAIFSGNDLSASGVLARADEVGLDVPADLSVIGYDNSMIASMRRMSLTTVNQPRDEMGAIAVELLVERLTSQRTTAVHHVVRPTLIARATTAPPSAGGRRT